MSIDTVNHELFIFQVDCSKTGPGVIVERFDGNGSGLTSWKNIDWQLNEDITFYVKGQYDGVCDIWFYYFSYLVYHNDVIISTKIIK